MWEQLIIVVHLLVAVAIIALILIQQGKGADAGASFGSGGSQTVFGSQGSGNFLTKTTTLLAVVFFSSSIGLAIIAKQKVSPIAEGIPVVAEEAEIPEAPVAFEESDIPSAGTAELEVRPGNLESDIPAVEASQVESEKDGLPVVPE